MEVLTCEGEVGTLRTSPSSVATEATQDYSWPPEARVSRRQRWAVVDSVDPTALPRDWFDVEP